MKVGTEDEYNTDCVERLDTQVIAQLRRNDRQATREELPTTVLVAGVSNALLN